MHQQVGVPSLEVYANAQMVAWSEIGDLDRAMEIATDLMRDHSATGLRTGWLAIARARVLVMRGELDEARRACDEAAVMFSDLNRHATLRWAHGGQALVAAYQGRVGDAADALATLDRIGPSAVQFLDADMERARAFHAAAAGDLAAARRLLHDAAERAEELGNLVLAVAAWHDLARVGSPGEAAEALARVVPHIESRWNEPRLTHATALARRDAAGVLDAAGSFAALGAMLHALEAAAQAHGLARADGQRSLAQRAVAATLAYAERCPGARTPPMRDAATIQLTPREREVAELVVGGRTSREAANSLGVSVRTVENLLQRVYTKLGIQDRAALADVLSSA
jgi:DNA-binding CsgD family transcriptional regulator